ncbi:coiled-coil domain-containing protein [Helicobacter pylori]|uniref:coiled-coil domain-containing protein n=1 Tax=Helicobacter pylori TaxID=210 RepID=UPI001FF43B8F|nr:hypothetical protein [Helicobacter pylori]MCK0498512.1 hypothetical protein [Helicobacter pylori]
MDLTNLENALNNGDFKEQVYRSLEGVYQISKVLNQLDLLKNFSDHDLEIIAKTQAIKNALAGYEISEQELKAKINALVNSLEAKKQELEVRLNMELQSARVSEIQKLNEAGNKLKTKFASEIIIQIKNKLEKELEVLKKASASALMPQMQGVIKFLGIYVYGRQTLFKNESDEFMELFEFSSTSLQANKTYILQFSMPFEFQAQDRYSDMGEMVLCLKANNNVYPIINSFYQNKTIALFSNNKGVNNYKVDCIFETPSEQGHYKIALFARKIKELWVNVNYSNSQGFETSFLDKAKFRDLTTKNIPTTYNNDWVFYKHSQAIVYEIMK